MTTDVEFYYHKANDDLFAWFTNERGSSDPKTRMSYSHIGQHSVAHIDYCKESEFATKEQYEPLKKELESIGYTLNVLNEQV